MNWEPILVVGPLVLIALEIKLGWHKHERFCLVEARGCMAHIRHGERWGTVVRRETRDMIGMSGCPGIVVKYDDGETVWHPSTWVYRANDGHLELSH